MNHFAEKHRFWIVALSAALFVWAGTVSSTALTNSTHNTYALTNGNTTVHSTPQNGPSGQTQSQWPTIAEVLSGGWDAGSNDIYDLTEAQVNDRFHAYSNYGGAGTYAVEDPFGNELADFTVVTGAGDFFDESQPGDMCLRSLSGPIRIGYVSGWDAGNSSLVVNTNGDVTVTQGALYITPQGDLSMGGFTNSPPH